MRSLAIAFAFASLAVASVRSPAAAEETPPFPPGESSQKLEGLTCSIVMPADFDPAKERSMVVVLHGAGGTETGMARSLAHLAKEEYVVLAPKSKGKTWDASDLEAVRKIVADLRKRLRVGAARLHGLGFSNGGWNLAPVVFDEDLRFRTAAWVAAGYNGGKPPKHAKKEMGVIALAGSKDGNRDSAEKTPSLLEDKVRTAEFHEQPGLGHEWPGELIPYYSWWLGAMEGRFVPGVCAALPWKDSPAAAAEAATAAKSGRLVWWYSAADLPNDAAKTFQNDVLRDAAVRKAAAAVPCAKADRDADADGFAATGAKGTPAVVVYDAAGKVKALLQGKIDAKPLAAALRAVAPKDGAPKDGAPR